MVREEHRTKSELVREALRFYVDTREVRKAAVRERAGALIDEIQGRTQGVPPKESDRDLLDLNSYRGVRIVQPGRFLTIIRRAGPDRD